MTSHEVRATAELVARTSYGRLVALLAAPAGDLSRDEDALATAFERALQTWPHDGIPANPDGWLLTVARNRLRDLWRSAAHRSAAPLATAIDRGLDAPWPLEELDIEALPDRHLLPERLPAVLEAVYGCFAISRPQAADAESAAQEARYLAVTLATLLGTEPEARGLAAMITLSSARAPLTTDRYVPLADQDPTAWEEELVAEGGAYLRRAGGSGPPGRFQLAVVGRLEGPRAGLDGLADLSGDPGFQSLHAVRANLLAAAGARDRARTAYNLAIDLSDEPAVRDHLEACRDQ